ncbi:hypothetical protein [[Pseudomonas] boreopolis]|uniref:Uncharacterized protein n=1 Tax=Xanthomonas boreopolis TaxID=86183 RepID=A0A919F719_9XANT|nr:hypothetical protein GCM10009090_13650 [[Pseudomonas] boreopolis]
MGSRANGHHGDPKEDRIAYARELSQQLDGMVSLPSAAGGVAYFKIVYRGEGVFYHHAGRSLICDLIIPRRLVVEKSISLWDDGARVADGEREQIKADLRRYFEFREMPVQVA